MGSEVEDVAMAMEERDRELSKSWGWGRVGTISATLRDSRGEWRFLALSCLDVDAFEF